jgi:bifunctional non-homologous end joining protein LigD
MPRVVKRSASQAITSGPSRSGRSRRDAPLPQFVPPQLSQPVDKPPSGPQWLHEIKLDGYRMAARIDNGRVQLLTRTALDPASPTRKSPRTALGSRRPQCLDYLMR